MPGRSPAAFAELLAGWSGGGPARRQLAATIRALILDGRLPLESRVPAEREAADALGVSRSTVTAAYDQLRREGYLTSRQGAGSWVSVPGGHRAAADALVPAGGIDLRIAALPAPAGLDEVVQEAVRSLPRWLDHHGYDPLGLPPLREAVARRFTRRGLPTGAEQILVTSGALQALDLVVRATFRRGRAAIAEIPSYPAALDVLRTAGARLRSVPTTSAGWDLDQLDAVAARGAGLAYLIPDFHNPTGALMDEAARRRALAALERGAELVVVDETFTELGLDGIAMPPPAAGLGGPRTITIGSLSKPVWGGLRIGWLRAEPGLVRRVAAARATTDMASPVLDQLVGVTALEALDGILAERRRLLRERREALCAALAELAPSWRYARPRGGLFVWLELPRPISTSLSVRARERGVHVTPGPRFGAPGLLDRFLRLPFTLPPEQLRSAVETLAAEAGRAAGRRVPREPAAYVA